MKIYIFPYLQHMSDRYHREGGVVVICENGEQLEEMIKQKAEIPNAMYQRTMTDIRIAPEEWEEALVYDLAGENIEPKLFAFPNAGCC